MPMNSKGQMMSRIIAVVIGVVMLVAVAIPIVTETNNSANLTGISATVADFIPVFLALGGLVLATRVFN